MRTACDVKFPKLANWKRAAAARTILILEDNDIQITNHAIVTETYVPLATARPDCPDQTYLISNNDGGPWDLFPILIDGHSLFDLEDAGQEVIFEIDPNTLTPITLR